MSTDLPAANADANQLEMALLNLAVNARDAMEEGGTLTISVKSCSNPETAKTGLPDGNYVCISVVDTGAGMDETTRLRAIEPFFSTKGIGKGTGLGLSMVHGLMAQLGGALTIESAPNKGTTVQLWLHVSDSAVEEEQPPAMVSAPKQLGTALLVDDEVLVRMSTADMLTELGYDVAEASSAEEALRLLKDGLRPDLLVTDHLMPGMSGVELAHKVKTDRPDLPVLIVSGYAERDGVTPDLLRLTKPFRQDELAERLAALFESDKLRPSGADSA